MLPTLVIQIGIGYHGRVHVDPELLLHGPKKAADSNLGPE